MRFPRGRKLPALFMVCCLCGLSFSNAFAVDVPNKKEIIAKARQSYYSLRTQGLVGFTCDIKPNWEGLLAEESKTDPGKAAQALQTLSQIHFIAGLGADGKVKLTHNDVAGQTPEMTAALNQIYGGMDQMTSGFFDTFSLFMLNSPFPEVESEYQLEDQGILYQLTYKEGAAGVVTTMDKDFVISSLSVTSPEFASTLQPSLLKNPKGLLLTGYMAVYKSKNPAEDTQLSVKIAYQELEEKQVIQKLSLSGSYGGSPFAVELTFSNYQFTKK